MDERLRLWDKLAGEWKIDDLAALAKTIGLNQLEPSIQAILAGNVIGRVLVEPK
jgi:hypothetical protein